jgi:hypothetical protein
MNVRSTLVLRAAAGAVFLLAAAAVFAPPATAGGDFDKVTDSLAQGQRIFEKTLTAFGGKTRLATIASMTQVVTVEIAGGDGTLALLQDSVIQVFPDKEARFTTSDSSREDLLLVVNGDDAWRVRNGNLEELNRPQVIVQRKAFEAAMVNLLTGFARPHFEIRFAGREKLNNQPVLRLDFRTNSGYQFCWFVNPDTYLPAAVSLSLDRAQGLYYIDHYQAFDSILIGTVVRLVRGERTINLTTTSVSFNAPYDSLIFTRPK